MKDEIDSLLQKEMDRKAFLKHVAVGFVALTGVSTVIKALNNVTSSKPKYYTHGYSSSAYGGKRVATGRSVNKSA